jgi:hypothetical protein
MRGVPVVFIVPDTLEQGGLIEKLWTGTLV